MLKLQSKNPAHRSIWLVEPGISIGSDPGCDWVVDGPGIAVRHASVRVEHERLTIAPTVADALVSVNGRRLTGPGPLQVGDRLLLGELLCEVIDPKQHRLQAKPALATVPVAAIGEPSGWSLKASQSALGNRIYPINGEALVGRAAECDIKLAATHLSRRHARLWVRDGQLFVKDLESANGTFLNGERVAEARVRRGDELRFDTLLFGVLGPADDLDKTNVRLPPVMPGPGSIDSVSTGRPLKPRAASRVVVRQAPADEPAVTQDSRDATPYWVWIVGILIAVVTVAVLLR